MKKEIEVALESLRYRHFNAIFAENSEYAKSIILNMIPNNAVVGIGDSTTVRQIGIKEELRKRGTKLLDGYVKNRVYISKRDWEEYYINVIKEASMCDLFLTGSNAITQDGKIVNVDGVGNRVAGMFYGHPMSILVVGRNKIVEDLDEAFYRIRNIIAPNHIRIRTVELNGRRFETPCVVTGKCHDCRSRDRACNIFTIIEGKPLRTDINVIIINEDLGLGWNESWPKERINKIIENYKKFVWIPPADLIKWDQEIADARCHNE
jgi:hypothetical protein